MAGPYYPKTYRAAASVNSVVLRDEQCNLGHLVFTNDGATECFLKLYDSASAPGTTDVPVQRYWLPPTTYNQGLAIGAGLKFALPMPSPTTTPARWTRTRYSSTTASIKCRN
jgi:hypothetical protein